MYLEIVSLQLLQGIDGKESSGVPKQKNDNGAQTEGFLPTHGKSWTPKDK